MTITRPEPLLWRSDRLVSAPAVLPVSYGEMKQQSRITADTEAELVVGYIRAATEYVQRMTGRALITQTRRAVYDSFDPLGFEIPFPPLQSVTSITYVPAGGGDAVTIDAGVYEVDADSEPGRVQLAAAQIWPGSPRETWAGISITYVAGYGATASTVPADLRHAIRLLAAHWYEHRETSSERRTEPVEFGVENLITPYRVSFLA